MTGVQQFGYTSNPGGLRALEGKLKHAPFTLYERIWKSLPGELWGRLQSAAGFSPPSRERCETSGRRTEVRRRLKPNAARFSQTWDSALIRWGGSPAPSGTPPSRSSLEEASPSITQQAGQGAGRRRGRPPHYLCRCAFVGKPCGIRLKPAPRKLTINSST